MNLYISGRSDNLGAVLQEKDPGNNIIIDPKTGKKELHILNN